MIDYGVFRAYDVDSFLVVRSPGVTPMDIRWRIIVEKFITKTLARPNSRLRFSLMQLSTNHPNEPPTLGAGRESILCLPLETVDSVPVLQGCHIVRKLARPCGVSAAAQRRRRNTQMQ